MNEIFAQIEDKIRKGTTNILTNNLLLSIALTLLAMILLKAFALDRKTLLRAFLIMSIVNYVILKTTQDIRLPGESFMRQAFNKPMTNLINSPAKHNFILAKQLEDENSAESSREDSEQESSQEARQPNQQLFNQIQQSGKNGSSSGLIKADTPIMPFQEDKTFVL